MQPSNNHQQRPIGFQFNMNSGQPGGYPPQQDGTSAAPYPQYDMGPSQMGSASNYQQQQQGYPSQQQTTYPSAQHGYPIQQQPASDYHPQQPSSGYPTQYQQPQSGYSTQQQPSFGYPMQSQASSGYSMQTQGQSGYPMQQQPSSGYPMQQQSGHQSISGHSVGGSTYSSTIVGATQVIGANTMAYSIGTPSVKPIAGFNANADAETLRKAMKGFGTNNAKVIAVLCGRSNDQRQQIAKAFKVMYGKDLLKDLRDELSGDFEDLILSLMEIPAKYDASQLRKAMEGLGTKESVLIEIMCSRTNAQIDAIRNQYKMMYNRDLEKDLIGETSGHFKRLLISLCAGGRDESNQVDALRANQDARKLYNAGERRLGTDESAFNAILASQNFAQLRAVFIEYEKVAKHGIERAIESEFSGDIKDGLIAIIKCVKNRPAFFAECLYNSMKGLGTRDKDLIRIIVTRCEVDMVQIRQEFQNIYKKSLESFIKSDCSGSYKDGLVALVIGN